MVMDSEEVGGRVTENVLRFTSSGALLLAANIVNPEVDIYILTYTVVNLVAPTEQGKKKKTRKFKSLKP